MATVERELRDLGVGERLSPIIPPGERTIDRVRRVVAQLWFRVAAWAQRAWRSLDRGTRLAWHHTRMLPRWVMAQPGWMVASCAAGVLLLVITVCVALI